MEREAVIRRSTDKLACYEAAHDRANSVEAKHQPETEGLGAAVKRRTGPPGWHSTCRKAEDDHASAQQSGCQSEEAHGVHTPRYRQRKMSAIGRFARGIAKVHCNARTEKGADLCASWTAAAEGIFAS